MARKRLTRAQAIRKHCIMCSGDNRAEVKSCTAKICYLWPYRMGYEIDPNTEKRVVARKTKDEE